MAILILLAYMAMVVVILLNVLIAQLSYTYSEAKRNAKLQYAIDRMRIVTRLEHSRFARFVSVVIVWFCYICELVYDEIVNVRYILRSSQVAYQADAFFQFLYHESARNISTHLTIPS